MNQLFFLYDVLRDFLEPLRRSFGSLEALEYRLFRYGWDISLTETDFDNINSGINLIAPLTRFLDEADALENSASDVPTAAELAPLAEASGDLFLALANLELSDTDSLAAPLNAPSFWSDVSDHLFDEMLETYLRVHYSGGYLALHLFGVIRYESREPAGDHRRPYVRTVFDWDRLVEAIGNPVGAFRKTYHWDDAPNEFDHQGLLTALVRVLHAVRVSAQLTAPNEDTLAGVPAGGDYAVAVEEDALRITLLDALPEVDPLVYLVGLEILPVTRSGDSVSSGLLIKPVLRGGMETVLPLGREYALRWTSKASEGDLISAVVLPEGTTWPSGAPTAGTQLEITRVSPDPAFLLGNARTSHIALSGASIQASAEGSVDSPEIKLQIKTNGKHGGAGLRAVVPLEDADGFIKHSVRQPSIAFPFSGVITWSSKTGLHVNGGGAFDVALPVNVNLGPVTLRNARLTLKKGVSQTGNPSVELRLGAAIAGNLGPLAFVIEDLGFVARITPYSRQDVQALPDGEAPLFGNLDLQLAFSGPNGIALSINAGPVKGSGTLVRDADRGRYLGTLGLTIAGVSVTAIGVLDTKDAEGNDLPTPGFSSLIIMSAEFPAVQLGFGFKLSGIGGLLGIHRSSNYELLRSGLSTGALDSVMFPSEPAADPSQTLRNLSSLFPVSVDRHIVGPMFLLGWGTPTLITIEVGVFITLGGPVPVQLLGQLATVLPSADGALIKLNTDVVGEADLAGGSLAIDGQLRNSFLVGFPLTGDLAIRARWKQGSTFGLSFGGFHPDYRHEQRFPELKRLALTISKGSNLRIAGESYLAVASNSIQFGTRAELYASAAGFSVDGSFEVNMLIILSPFSFKAGVEFDVSLSFKGRTFASISLEFELSGPQPWRAKGKLKIKICFVTFHRSFNKSWGALVAQTLPPRPVWPELEQALADSGNWTAILPPHSERDVLLAPRSEEDGVVTLHPHGVLEVRQRVVPFDLELERFGSGAPEGDNRFDLPTLIVGRSSTLGVTAVEDVFAPGQFLNLTEEEKLSRPSFEQMGAGVRIGSTAVHAAEQRRTLTVEYETQLVSPDRQKRRAGPLDRFVIFETDSRLDRMSRATRTRSPPGEGRFRNAGRQPAIIVNAERYKVAETALGTTGTRSVSSIAEANQAIRRLSATGETARGLITIGASELS